MDDLYGTWHGRGIREADTLVEVCCHHVPYVDAAEVGEAAARIFLRRDPADIGKDLMLNNGVDFWDFYDVAKFLSSNWGEKSPTRKEKSIIANIPALTLMRAGALALLISS